MPSYRLHRRCYQLHVSRINREEWLKNCCYQKFVVLANYRQLTMYRREERFSETVWKKILIHQLVPRLTDKVILHQILSSIKFRWNHWLKRSFWCMFKWQIKGYPLCFLWRKTPKNNKMFPKLTTRIRCKRFPKNNRLSYHLLGSMMTGNR